MKSKPNQEKTGQDINQLNPDSDILQVKEKSNPGRLQETSYSNESTENFFPKLDQP